MKTRQPFAKNRNVSLVFVLNIIVLVFKNNPSEKNKHFMII